MKITGKAVLFYFQNHGIAPDGYRSMLVKSEFRTMLLTTVFQAY